MENLNNVVLKSMGTINKNFISFFGIDFYISYKTIVAVNINNKLFCCENVFSKTTGKYLNEIEKDKTKRLKQEDFNKLLNKIDVVLSELTATEIKNKLIINEI